MTEPRRKISIENTPEAEIQIHFLRRGERKGNSVVWEAAKGYK